jgi:hypothetical protein
MITLIRSGRRVEVIAGTADVEQHQPAAGPEVRNVDVAVADDVRRRLGLGDVPGPERAGEAGVAEHAAKFLVRVASPDPGVLAGLRGVEQADPAAADQ